MPKDSKKHPKRKRRSPVWLRQEDFVIRESTVKGIGYGLFARTRIRKGDMIGHYTGKQLTENEANNEPYVNSRYLVWICKDWYIDGEGPLGNYTRYINHSSSPNTELLTSTRWRTAAIRAIKRIEPGEELFFDYGDEYWNVLGEPIQEH